jgi:hypothetical protein
MRRTAARIGGLLPLIALALLTVPTAGQGPPADKGTGAEKPAAKADPAAVAELIRQLASPDFKERDRASQQLAGLDEVPDALRDAAKHPDAEVDRRARAAADAITARAEERAFQAIARELQKVELDRFVRRMVTEEGFARDRQWDVIQAVVDAVTKEATKLGGRAFGPPNVAVRTMPRLLLDRETKNPNSAHGWWSSAPGRPR